jgi:hypothetical protein
VIKILIGVDFFTGEMFDGNISAGSEISRIDIENTKIDQMKIDTGISTQYNTQMAQAWDYDTVFDCKFTDLNFEAGNLSLNGMPIEYLRIKKRKENQLTWQTYKNIAYDSNETNYTWSDYFVQSLNSYQYAIVPVGANDVQGEYGIASIDCEYEDIWIMGSNNVQYHLIANIEMGDIQYVTESSLVTTLGSQFPYRIQNGNLKYRKGSITAMLVSDSTLEGNNGTIDRVAEKTLRENFEDFLTNGKPKLIKESEGRYMLCSIDISSIKITPNNDLSRRIGNVNFEFVEIGDSQNVTDLTNNALLA